MAKQRKKYVMYAKHGWNTVEATYNEVVRVKKGYAIVANFNVVGVMKARGYDLIHILKDNEEFDLKTGEVIVKKYKG